MNIEELLQDEAFVESIRSAADMNAVAASFQEKGVSITQEDLQAALAAGEGELNEDALDNVAGGISASNILLIFRRLIPILPKPLTKR